MKLRNNSRQMGIALVAGILLFVGIGIVHQSAHASSEPSYTRSNALPQLPQLPPLATSCLETSFHYTPITPGIGVNLGITSTGEEIKGGETGVATGEIHGDYIYSITVGTLVSPITLQGHGFITVSTGPADTCQYDHLMSKGAAPLIPSTTILDTSLPSGLTITGISGEVFSFQEASGRTGQFNYVTGAYVSK